eukprot:404133_1
MDIAIYASILKWRGEDPYALVDSYTNKTMSIAVKVFRQDIFHDKCVWVNKLKQDFLYFIQSRHPLISTFQCPSYHPYSKQKRRSTLLVMFSLGSFFAFASSLLALYGSSYLNIDVKGINPTKEVLILRLLCSICNGIVLWFCDLSLTKIQSCICAETQQTMHRSILCKVFSAMTIWLYLAISLMIFSFSLYMVFLLKLTSMFLMVFALQFICSWLFQFVGLYIRFKRLWIRDHKMVSNNQKSLYYLTYKDYEEYRFSTKLNALSSKRNINTSQNKSIQKSIDNPLLLDMDDDVKNENDEDNRQSDDIILPFS